MVSSKCVMWYLKQHYELWGMLCIMYKSDDHPVVYYVGLCCFNVQYIWLMLKPMMVMVQVSSYVLFSGEIFHKT